MGVAIVTGSGGLIGSESVRHFAAAGLDVIGLDNDMRARFFGPRSLTRPTLREVHDRNAERWIAEVEPAARGAA